jgi:hypothetical protein
MTFECTAIHESADSFVKIPRIDTVCIHFDIRATQHLVQPQRDAPATMPSRAAVLAYPFNTFTLVIEWRTRFQP